MKVKTTVSPDLKGRFHSLLALQFLVPHTHRASLQALARPVCQSDCACGHACLWAGVHVCVLKAPAGIVSDHMEVWSNPSCGLIAIPMASMPASIIYPCTVVYGTMYACYACSTVWNWNSTGPSFSPKMKCHDASRARHCILQPNMHPLFQ